MSDENIEDVQSKISFFQGSDDISGGSPIESIKQKIAEFSNVKNVSFLLGAGTSSGAIPSMKSMHEEISKDIKESTELNSTAKTTYKNVLKDNLEDVLNILYAKKSYMQGSTDSENQEQDSVDSLIEYIENKIFTKINIDLSDGVAKDTLDIYKRLYQKTALRNKDLSRINVFTTNNDLCNEKALDNLNINYNNGFGGGLDRVFNPARFHYTFSKKIDANLEKFEPLESMVYLYKLHGSISWVEKEGNSLFNIQEIPVVGGSSKPDSDHVLIYPTPLKQSQSLGSPYSDLIREFQTKLSQQNSVLFIIGYSFSDEHLNNIIYQSLASNSSISIVIFGEYPECPLVKISDSRIYRIFGSTESGEKIHYFEYIVNSLLPDLDENKEKILLDDFVSAFKSVVDSGDKK
ncbi:MAG: SIR2 family protein [Candidatus Thiodiazotropha sp. (ex Lucinoma kastoroae)]|nr:SIR2 family protein [Candidatus Thiodiazotropha sp. (ex Lucinoma kastoroae)]